MIKAFFSRWKYLFIIFAFFALFFAFARFEYRILKNEHELTSCYVKKVSIVGRTRDIVFECQFQVHGQWYNTEEALGHQNIDFDSALQLQYKYLPVVYNNKHYRMISRILVAPFSYSRLNVPFPDSLNWIVHLFKDN